MCVYESTHYLCFCLCIESILFYIYLNLRSYSIYLCISLHDARAVACHVWDGMARHVSIPSSKHPLTSPDTAPFPSPNIPRHLLTRHGMSLLLPSFLPPKRKQCYFSTEPLEQGSLSEQEIQDIANNKVTDVDIHTRINRKYKDTG